MLLLFQVKSRKSDYVVHLDTQESYISHLHELEKNSDNNKCQKLQTTQREKEKQNNKK